MDGQPVLERGATGGARVVKACSARRKVADTGTTCLNRPAHRNGGRRLGNKSARARRWSCGSLRQLRTAGVDGRERRSSSGVFTHRATTGCTISAKEPCLTAHRAIRRAPTASSLQRRVEVQNCSSSSETVPIRA